MMHPYQNIPDYRLWGRSVSNVELSDIDPIVRAKFRITSKDKLATAGSCFAQHISRRISALDYNYFVPESGHTLTAEVRARQSYGVFSARFGNIYTVRQLLQLFQEVFGLRDKGEKPWARPDGRYVDPFRPNVEPDGFASAEEVGASRADHLEHVRRVFLESDIFVFTLGLTEGWESRATGDVFPLAPGVVAGDYRGDLYRFVNFSIDDVRQDLKHFLSLLKDYNPHVNVLLTVSPVALIATAERRHVAVSTTYSKSVLRVAAEEACKGHDWVDYFPSYEIITSSFAGGRYYEDDLREVNSLGVDHVMRCFMKHYIDMPRTSSAVSARDNIARNLEFTEKMRSVVCDEESIAAVSG